MKHLQILALALALPIFSFACEIDLHRAPAKVQKAFEAMFPDARHIEWEKEMTLYKAEFYSDGLEKEAWYDKHGNWKRTKTELSVLAVPENILEAAKATVSGSWDIDDVDFYEQPTGVTEFYRIEFEKVNSDRERVVRIRPDGKIVTDFKEIWY